MTTPERVRDHIDALLFDLDGTVLDSARDFELVLNLQLVTHDLPPINYERLRSVASSGAHAMIELAFGNGRSKDQLDTLRQEFLHLYAEHLSDASHLFPGIKTLIDWAHREQLPLAIATNKPSHFTLPLLEQLDLSKDFAAVICPDHVAQPKPSPDSLLLAAKQLGARPQRCLYIGDHLRDIVAGKAAGMTTVGCRYGYLAEGEEIESWQADHLITEADEIITLCEKIVTSTKSL